MEIDFVILWVDGNDPAWRQEKSKYDGSAQSGKLDDSAIRYRDWENLKYWFRAVEQFAPWVRKIHFVTWGHVPSFLNVYAPKLHIVKHEDFIPKECLPVFNSCAIEINLHRIPGLAEQFVYFNDDMFLGGTVYPEDFFWNGLPRDAWIEHLVMAYGNNSSFCHHLLNDIDVINRHFDKRRQMKNHVCKWFNYQYGLRNMYNFYYMPFPRYLGFKLSHLPNAYLKSTFEAVWEKEFEILDKSRHYRFRSKDSVSQCVFKYWQLASGEFSPGRTMGRSISVTDSNVEWACREIVGKKHKMLCLNDSEGVVDFEHCKQMLIGAFETILPSPSSFEI